MSYKRRPRLIILQLTIEQDERIPPEGKFFPFEQPLKKPLPSLDKDLDIVLQLYSNEEDGPMENNLPLDHAQNQSKCEGNVRSDYGH